MKPWPCFRTAAALLGLASSLAAKPVARWEFDGNLTDVSGGGHDAAGTNVAFVATDRGQGLAPGVALTIPSRADVQLLPQWEIRCRFRLDSRKDTPQVLITKDKEYLLRVDWLREGGQLSFFVFVDGGWEPRLRGPLPRLGSWTEIRAVWDGSFLIMESGGQRWIGRRRGPPQPTDNPVEIGPFQGIIDRLELRNPGYARRQTLRQLQTATPATSGADIRHFGHGRGWAGWKATPGARLRRDGDVLHADLLDPEALIVSPPLALPALELPLVSVTIDAPEHTVLGLNFVTDTDIGSVTFRPLGRERTTVIRAAEHPAWKGTIRRLAISLMDDTPRHLTCHGLTASRVPEGPPFLYVRNLAPEHAKLRSGRPERLMAVVKNLGGQATGIRVRLSAEPGVRLLDGAERIIPALAPDTFDLLTWTLQADRPVTSRVTVRAAADAGHPGEKDRVLHFTALPDLPPADYVPEPRPATTSYLGLMHYCALWKEGTHYGWGKIEPWPERRPAIGFYDEGTPEVADWHIKTALEHGISGFIYCWYRTDFSPEIHQMLGHAIHEGLFRARYRGRFHFCIMWENGCAKGVKDTDDLLHNLFPFWMKNYFTHPSYVKIGNRPLLFVWRPEKVGPQLGGTAATRAAFDAMRSMARDAGFAGLRIIGCLSRADAPLQRRLAEEGWDATSGYGLRPAGEHLAGTDIEGIPYMEYAESLRLYKSAWLARRHAGPLPDIPNVMMGWDPRPWHGNATKSYRAHPSAEVFEAACRDAKALVDEAPADAWYRRLVVFDNWTEFGEGHYIEPTAGTGFDYVNAIKRVFCTAWAPESVTDIIPEDVGLSPPQQRYLARRALFGGMPWRPRVIRDHTIGWWHFNGGSKALFLDASASCFHLLRRNAPLVPGKSGTAMLCGEGWSDHPAHQAFFPSSGISIALWCNPNQAGQSDTWMVNTVGNGTNGYRLGFTNGRPAWQIPRERWSHILVAPKPLPVQQWSHVTATFDNRVMRLFVNGVLVGELSRPGPLRASTSSLHVGSYSGSRARFQGRLDELRIWDRPLGPDEVARLAAE